MSDCMQSDVSDAPEFGVNFRDGEIQWPISSILLFLPMRKQPRRHWVSRFTAASPVARGFARYRTTKPRSRSSVWAIGAFPPASLRTRREVNPHRSAVRRRRHSDAFAVPCSDEPLWRHIGGGGLVGGPRQIGVIRSEIAHIRFTEIGHKRGHHGAGARACSEIDELLVDRDRVLACEIGRVGLAQAA